MSPEVAAAFDDARRSELLRTLSLGDTEPEPAFDRLARLAAQASGMPVALATFVDEHGMWVKGRHGWDRPWTPLAESICRHALGSDALLLIDNLAQDARTRDNPIVAADDGFRFYAGAPVVLEGIVLGTVCVLDRQPRRLQAHQAAALRDAAAAVAELVAWRRDQWRRDRESQALAASQASRSKSEFLSRVSHELRTPLNAVLGFSQLLLLDDHAPLDAAQREQLLAVRSAGERLLAMVNDMLDLSRIEQGKLPIELREIDLRAAVDDAALMLHAALSEAAVTLHNEVAPGLRALCDERGLGQVLINLLSNAVKYNRHGGTVRVAAAAIDGGVELVVEDSGLGMTEDQLSRLFQPFDRLGAERSGIAGTGLGLVIVKALAEAMGGGLQVQSQAGKGSTVRLRLKAGAPAATPAAVEAQRRVIYVEDEPVNALLMRALFGQQGNPQAGWQLVCAGSAAEAMDTMRRERFDLALIDMNLPDMDGLTLLRALVREGLVDAKRCIALSADAMPEQVSAALAGGFAEYWTKPLDITEVRRRLSLLLS